MLGLFAIANSGQGRNRTCRTVHRRWLGAALPVRWPDGFAVTHNTLTGCHFEYDEAGPYGSNWHIALDGGPSHTPLGLCEGTSEHVVRNDYRRRGHTRHTRLIFHFVVDEQLRTVPLDNRRLAFVGYSDDLWS